MVSAIEIVSRAADCIRLVQITDTHIFADSKQRFDGLDTLASLDAVIRQIKTQDSPDLVLVTGDLVHDPLAGAYRRLQRQLSTLALPVFCLPGNHDDPGLMRRVLRERNVRCDKLITAGAWGIILLDTHLPGSHAGRLEQGELDFLRAALLHFASRPVLIGLHHPPVTIGSGWMDAMMLENSADLFAELDRHANVRLLAWGHIHQEFRSARRGVRLYGAPSTCIQFKPGCDSYTRDELGPAYTLLSLSADGRVELETLYIALPGSPP